MTLFQTMTWTPFPAGWNESNSTRPLLKVSVLLTPKLTWSTVDTKTLGDFPDFNGGAWPNNVVGGTTFGGVRFEVKINGTPLSLVDTRRVSADPNPDLFAVMLPPTMPVTKWTDDDFSGLRFRSFPLAGLSAILDELQGSGVVPDPTQRPNVSNLYYNGGGHLAPLAINGVDQVNWSATDAANLVAKGYTEVPDVTTDAGKAHAVAQLRDFLTPTRSEAQLRQPLVWTQRDFHETISMFGSHPNLLRALGLLIDLEVDPSSVVLPEGNQVLLTVTPMYSASGAVTNTDVCATVVANLHAPTIGTRVFELSPRTAAITGDGVVDMTGWAAVTSEAETEVLAHVTMASDLQRAAMQGLRTSSSPQQLGLPARRSAGIAVTRPGTAQAVHALMGRARQLQQGLAGGAPLYAEDLAVGYRLDVRKAAGEWRSLHRRRGSLDVTGLGVFDLGADEGWAEMSFTDDVDGRVRRVPETMVRWWGWSLALARPGQFLGEDGQLMPPPSALPEGVHGNLQYGPPLPTDGGAHLPTLRFGVEYQLRLRLTDPAGRSRIAGAASSALTTKYLRYEPIPSGEIYLLGTATRGEQPEVLVVRSEGGGAAVAVHPVMSRRVLLPPRGSVWLAEQHGRLDAATGAPRADLYAQLATRDRASFDPASVTANSYVPTTFQVPYLVDPVVTGARIQGAPQAGNQFAGSVSGSFGVVWPTAHGLELRAVPAAVQGTTSASGIITASIAPGRVAHLRVSSTMSVASLPLFDLWNRRGVLASQVAAAGGQWWQLTPDRTVKVVHATRRPVSPPRFRANNTWTVVRPLGETAARLTGSISADRPSTQNLAVLGDLTSGVDLGPRTAAPAIVVTQTGELADIQVADPAPGGSEGSVPGVLRVPLPDTKARLLTLTAVATSRFADYFRVGRTIQMNTHSATLDSKGNQGPVVPGSLKVTYTNLQGHEVHAGEGNTFHVDHATGVLTTPQAFPPMPLAVSWIPQSITLVSTQTKSAGERSHTVVLPATTRPDPVSVAWVVPAFRWNAVAKPTALYPTRTSVREGGMLRIYLNRPWYSSGIDEYFAVVVHNGRTPGSDPVSEMLTRWGQDPLTEGAAMPRTWPLVTNFVNRDSSFSDAMIPDLPGKRANLALYAIGRGQPGQPVSGYDADRDLWWVDLEIDQGIAYRPFIRLALARYQPHADPSIRLSPITVLDVVQLEPDRTATVNVPFNPLGNAQTVKATVTLTGPTYRVNSTGSGVGQATLILEHNDVADPTHQRADWTESARVSMTASINTNIGTWTGSISVPANRPAGRYRLVVEQFERWRTDGSPSNSFLVAQYGQRLVHQDILPI